MTMIIDGVRYSDLSRIWKECESASHVDKMQRFLEATGCTFYDDAHTVVKTPTVSICGFGGFPIQIIDEQFFFVGQPTTPMTLLNAMKDMRGWAGCMTNLNPGNKSAHAMADILDHHGHNSAYRINTVDLLFSGYSAAIEANFQRNYKYAHHIGVITFTRTGAQHFPPQVALSEVGAQRILQQRQIHQAWHNTPIPHFNHRDDKLDYIEEFNSELPKNTAMAIMVSMDLKNLKSMMKDIHDMGQELAWRQLMIACNNQLQKLWPHYFNDSM